MGSMTRVLLLGACLAGTARAEYSDECRDLARRLAVDPGSLSAAELDLVKNCVASLQRVITLGEPRPAPGDPLPCAAPPPAPVTPACPACPTAAQLCPRPAAPAKPAREPPEDRRLKPYLPKY